MALVKSSAQNPTKVYQDRNLQIIFLTILMAVLGATSITPAFPRLARELSIPTEQVGWLTTAFMFPVFLATPITGLLADRWGTKKIVVPSLILFAVAGTACAFIQDFKSLIELRFIQGIGAASLESLGLTSISKLYSGEKLTAAMGYNSSVIGMGLVIYPLIGGALATLGWRFPFLLPLIAIPVGVIVLFKLKIPEKNNTQNFKEYLGSVGKSINNHQVIGLFVATFSLFVLLFGAFFTYIPMLVGTTLGASDLFIGTILSTMAVTIALVSAQLEKLIKFFSELILIKVSFILYAIALIIIPFIHYAWAVLISAVIFGCAHSLVFPCSQALLARLAPNDCRAGFMAVNATILTFGQAVGPLIAGAAFTLWGMNGVFYFSAIFSAVTLILLQWLLPQR
ncbi:MFS transporter [Gloeothece verrucosa]|uniref:Major facilitator superfamily MFS_1 n=1 Tax=Gloeothece verrucosa (strain PCC 7822) TaxID=497965 RepID=E0ULP5_GLOV7|nr:MFS transporter [Gloeothece verrucosa]ADN17875.1 major facilitator superfamily MFS_1 [Gloeothece verrucosa PCC 7822]